MKTFTLESFTRALLDTAAVTKNRIQYRLEEAAHLIKDEAKSYIGIEHSDWPPLEDSTKRIKKAAGFGDKGPLERTGEMRDSIKVRMLPLEVIVESDNRALYYHEKGTEYMPRRPVLSRAVFKNRDALALLLGKSIHPLITLTKRLEEE